MFAGYFPSKLHFNFSIDHFVLVYNIDVGLPYNLILSQLPFGGENVALSSLGAQWLSGRVLKLELKGYGFEPHWSHCGVSLSNTH